MVRSLTVAMCVAVIGMLSLPASDVQARPPYLAAFKAEYPALMEKADTAKCNICHFGDKKSNKNDYGMAYGGKLGAKNVKEEAKLKEALVAAAGEKSSTEGKTFGDLITAGELPGKAPAE